MFDAQLATLWKFKGKSKGEERRDKLSVFGGASQCLHLWGVTTGPFLVCSSANSKIWFYPFLQGWWNPGGTDSRSRHRLINQKANLLMNNEKWIVLVGQHMLLFCFATPLGKPNQEEEMLQKLQTQRKRALVDGASDKPHSYSQNACHGFPPVSTHVFSLWLPPLFPNTPCPFLCRLK